MREFNSSGAEWNIGLDQDGSMCRVTRQPDPQARIGQFLSVVEQSEGDAERRKISGRNGDHSLRRVHVGHNIVETVAIKNGRAKFRCALPVRRAESVQKADRVASSGYDAERSDVFRSRLAIAAHAVERRLLFSLLVKIHFVLQGKQTGGRSVGIELVVNREKDARRIHGVRDRAKMPGQMPEKIALLNDSGLDFCCVHGILREQNTVLQQFTRSKWNWGNSRRGGWGFGAGIGRLGFFLCEPQNRADHPDNYGAHEDCHQMKSDGSRPTRVMKCARRHQ
jgi:hypothetical protein